MNKILSKIVDAIKTGDRTYLVDIEKQAEYSDFQKEKEIENEYKNYEIVSIILDIVKDIYDAQPQTTKDKVSSETKTKYQKAKNTYI